MHHVIAFHIFCNGLDNLNNCILKNYDPKKVYFLEHCIQEYNRPFLDLDFPKRRFLSCPNSLKINEVLRQEVKSSQEYDSQKKLKFLKIEPIYVQKVFFFSFS